MLTKENEIVWKENGGSTKLYDKLIELQNGKSISSTELNKDYREEWIRTGQRSDVRMKFLNYQNKGIKYLSDDYFYQESVIRQKLHATPEFRLSQLRECLKAVHSKEWVATHKGRIEKMIKELENEIKGKIK